MVVGVDFLSGYIRGRGRGVKEVFRMEGMG